MIRFGHRKSFSASIDFRFDIELRLLVDVFFIKRKQNRGELSLKATIDVSVFAHLGTELRGKPRSW